MGSTPAPAYEAHLRMTHHSKPCMVVIAALPTLIIVWVTNQLIHVEPCRRGPVLAGELLLRHGSNAGNSLDTSIAARLGSLTLPSSMDIARYLEQVQFVDLPEASPRKWVPSVALCACWRGKDRGCLGGVQVCGDTSLHMGRGFGDLAAPLVSGRVFRMLVKGE